MFIIFLQQTKQLQCINLSFNFTNRTIPKHTIDMHKIYKLNLKTENIHRNDTKRSKSPWNAKSINKLTIQTNIRLHALINCCCVCIMVVIKLFVVVFDFINIKCQALHFKSNSCCATGCKCFLRYALNYATKHTCCYNFGGRFPCTAFWFCV